MPPHSSIIEKYPSQSDLANQIPPRPKAARPRCFARSSNPDGRSPTSAPPKSSASPGCCAKWACACSPPRRCRSGPGASPRACIATARPPKPAPTTPRGALDFIAAHPRRRHLPPQGFSRAAARIGRNPAPPARRLRELPRPAEVRRHHARRSASFRRKLERSILFLELRPPDLVELVDVPARREPRPRERRRCCTSWRAPCRAHPRRSALRAAPRAGRQPDSGAGVAAGAARREAAAGQPQRRHRVHRRRHAARRGRRPRRPEEVAAGAPQAVSRCATA